MATTTTLGFSILSRYSGHGVTQARRDLTALRAQMATINGDLQRHTSILNGIPQRWKAIGVAAASVLPALVPLSAAALQIGGTFAAMSVAVGAALTAYGAAMKGAITKTMEMAKAGKALSPVQKEFVSSVNGMKSAWQGFIKATMNQTLSTATHVVKGLTNGIKLLKPLVDAIHPSLLQVAKDFEAWTKGDSAKNYSNILANMAKAVMPNLVAAGKSMLNVLGDGFRAFAPLAKGMSESIAKTAASLNSWSDGGGFQRFLQYVRENGPAVNAFWTAFKQALANVLAILKEFAGGSLAILTDALRAIAAINPESLKAFANALLLIKAPMLWLVLNCPPLRDAMIGLIGAMNPQMIYAVAAAFVALRIAFMVMNTALLTTPLGLIIVGLVALGVAITTIATKTTWFQTAWTYTWNFIKTVGLAIWNALQVAFTAFINAMVVAWQTVSGALSLAWNTVWNAMATAVRVVWSGLQIAWAAFTTALATAWTTVSAALTTAWNAVWNALGTAARAVWSGLQIAWTAFTTALSVAWTTVSAALVAAWNAVWNAISLVARTVWTALQVAWSAFINALSITWTTVSAALSAAWSAVWNAMRTAAQAVWTAMQAAWTAFINAIRTVWTTMAAALTAAWNATWNALRTAAQAVWTAMQTAWSAFMNALNAAWNAFRTAFQAAWTAMWNAVRTVATTVWAAIRVAWSAFTTAMLAAWNAFRTALSTAWSAMWTLLRTTATTIWTAIRTAWSAFITAMLAAWNAFRTALATAWSAFWNLLKTAAQAIWDSIKAAWKGLTDGVREIWNSFSSAIKEAWSDTWNALFSTAKSIWNKIGAIIEKAVNGVIGIINTLIGGFNNVAKFLSIDISIGKIGRAPNFQLAEGGMVEFAYGGMTGAPKNLTGGGTLGGYAPGRDTVPAMLSRGEGVLTPEAVRGLGGPGFVHSANKTWAGHRGAGKGGKRWGKNSWDRSKGVNNRQFANGGMVGGPQHFAIGGLVASALAKAGVSSGMVSQGEYSNGSLSAGTHAGGGVVDISSTSPAIVAALRAAGFAAWARTGPAWAGNEHIHAVLMNHPDLSGPAKAQVASFLAGGNGLGVGGDGGSGGGPPAWLEGLMSKAGEILSRVAQGLDIGGIFESIFGGGGGGDKKDDGGGLFGTGIGPDIGPDITPGDNLGDAIGKGLGFLGDALKLSIPGFGPLGKMMLGLIPDDAFDFAFKWVTDKLKAFTPGAGGVGDMAIDMGSKSIKGAVKFLIGKNSEKKAEAMAAVSSAGGGGSGNVQQWAGLAAKALAMAGLPASQLGKFLALMQAESGGNPGAANLWDSNAAMGQASRGLMQVIPSTFAAYRDKSLPNNILDPLANMVASANYIKARYGGSVPGSPYQNGTPGATRGVHLVGEQGPELMNFAGGETITPAGDTQSILAGAGQTTMPEDMMERFRLLMALAQQMATKVQAAWTMATGAGKTAQSGMTPVFTDIATKFGTDIPTSLAAMATANTTQWTAMQAGTTTAWTAMRDTTFAEAGDHMSVKMPTWGTEMGTAVGEAWVNMGSATATAWEGMKEGTRGPTNWIIENSYNNGIRSLWNQVAEVIFEDGAKQLPSVQALATGGPVRGMGGERADRVPAMLSRGEHVWTAREVHRAGGHHAVQSMRSGVMGKGVRGAHGGRGFALGGWLGGVGNVGGSSPVVPTLDLKRGSMMDEVGDHLDQIDSSVKAALAGSFYRRMAGSAAVTSPTDWMRQYIEKDDELNKIGSGGPPWIPGVSDAITSYGGMTVNQRTADMLAMAASMAGAFSLSQGSFSTGVSASAGTHDGGGVVDIASGSNALVGALRAVGFAAWLRTPAEGFSTHIHAVALGDPTVSPGAASQIQSYLAGGNGLANGGPDSYSGGIPTGVDGVAGIGGGGQKVDPADLEQRVVSYDQGGFLQPGYTLAFNGTGKPEPVGHHLEPKGSRGVEISMPITINGNADAQAIVDGINAQVLPKLRQALNKGIGSNG